MENCRCLKYTVGKTEFDDFVDLIHFIQQKRLLILTLWNLRELHTIDEKINKNDVVLLHPQSQRSPATEIKHGCSYTL